VSRLAHLIVVALAWLPAVAPVVEAEERPGALQLEQGHSRPAAAPRQETEQKRAAEDAERAMDALRAREGDDALIRSELLSPGGRPDLGYDVRSGIQSRSLRDALRTR
jgi:hypothetical protein